MKVKCSRHEREHLLYIGVLTQQLVPNFSFQKKENILTENIIKNSIYFPRIEQRYRNFSKDNLLTLTYTDAYVESFFNSPTDIYIRNQQIVKVDKVEIYDKDGKLYLEDRLV